MSAPQYTLQQLLAIQGLDEIRARYLASLQGAGFPALTVWVPKAGVEMADVNTVASFLTNDIAADMPAMIAGGFLGKGTEGFLDVFVESVFLLKRNGASKTQMNWDLVCPAGVGPYTFNPGDLQLVAETGNQYVNIGDGPTTLEGGSFVTARFEAIAAGGSFNDDPATIGFTLMTTLAGVTLRLSQPPFSSITQSGASTGRIVPSQIGTIGEHVYILRIDTPGDPGIARYSVSIDGAAFIGGGILKPTGNVIGDTVNAAVLSAYTGAGSPSSFLYGDTFAFSAPGGQGYIQGSDAESNASYAARARSRWQTLSRNPTAGLFTFWTLRAVPQASRLLLGVDPLVPGRAQMLAADAHKGLDPSSLATIMSYIRSRLSDLESFVATAAGSFGITATGSVLVPANDLVQIQQDAQKAWTSFLGQTSISGVVRPFDLIGILEDAGATDAVVDGDQINLNGGFADVVLPVGTIPIESASIIDTLNWITS